MSRNRIVWALALAILALPAAADQHGTTEPASAAQKFFDYLTEGTVTAFVRPRWENARIDDTKVANALTIRTALGYGTKPWYGASVYAQFENIASADGSLYYDGVGANVRGRTIVADPTVTELNQAYGNFTFDEVPLLEGTKSALRGGRQTIVYDDARHIGNVIWRQNEQTYDAVKGSTSLGVEGLDVQYAYVWEVHRIFGDEGARGAGTRDYGSDSHFVRLNYSGLEFADIAGFAYLYDFQNNPSAGGPPNSANTFGFRAKGSLPISDGTTVVYAGSYAHQSDAANNPIDYDANYGAIDVGLALSSLGTLGGGYEVLGSDDGMGQFRTPLATAHKFNGWADAWLDNGGAFGLRDAYGYFAPKLPWGLKGRVVFHQFWSDSGGTKRGTELDAILTRKVFKYVELMAKFGWYKAQNINAFDGGRPDRHRLWLQATFKF